MRSDHATELTPPAADEPDLAGERAHLAAARAALRQMRERAQALFATGEGVAGDGYAAETLGTALARRVASLADDPRTPLFFGKLTFDTAAGEQHYIGRRHVTDQAREPLVLDWRAPVSRAFYQASAADPRGVRVRRRFGFAAGALTSFEDEWLAKGEELGTASALLTAEIERPRVGPMRDIVATIAPEQDALVRADLAESLCVQGSPGTGKTAVGLHRAAYLLYLHRERLRRSGVLVVGPNRAFLRYIGEVLPALGEVEVAQATIDELVARAPVRGADPAPVAALKHEPRMATVLRNALWARVLAPVGSLVLPDGSYRWRIDESTLAALIDQVSGEQLPYLSGRERLRARVVAHLQAQCEARRAESPSDSWLRRAGRSRPVSQFLDAAWPAVTPEGLVAELLTDPATLARAADGVLEPAEQQLLRWVKPPRSVRGARWSEADLVLIDEAAGLLERLPSYGHVVVDEAQDLSPMQARVIARRSSHGSLTVLGDLAQGTTPWAATDWSNSLAALGKPGAPVTPLTTGFRVPAEVVALANRLLGALAVDVPPAVSLRRDGALTIRQVGDLDEAVVTEARAGLAREGSIAVIAPDADGDRLRALLETTGVPVGEPGSESRLTLTPASLAKGLEYDQVVVVEPAAIVAAEPRGLHRLYVVLTRTVSRLTLLHQQPLPAPLRS